MTQFRADTKEFWGANKTIYEVMMLADKDGNRIASNTPLPVFVFQNRILSLTISISTE